MNIDQKLTAIRDAIQQDIGNRGLARDPVDNLFTACPGDFANACASVAEHADPSLALLTGFFVSSAEMPAFETDGPLGICFVKRVFSRLRISTGVVGEGRICNVVGAGLDSLTDYEEIPILRSGLSHVMSVEQSGPAADGNHYTMRGWDVTAHHRWARAFFDLRDRGEGNTRTIGIGDGGNEIGMGKIPHETIVKNIPNGDLIHCRVPTDHLIVAGVSNWGAYALAAGVALLRGARLPAELFDPDRERAILQTMVEAGPLVDGVTGKQTATVDGLSWDDYIKPLVEIGKIVRA